MWARTHVTMRWLSLECVKEYSTSIGRCSMSHLTCATNSVADRMNETTTKTKSGTKRNTAKLNLISSNERF